MSGPLRTFTPDLSIRVSWLRDRESHPTDRLMRPARSLDLPAKLEESSGIEPDHLRRLLPLANTSKLLAQTALPSGEPLLLRLLSNRLTSAG